MSTETDIYNELLDEMLNTSDAVEDQISDKNFIEHPLRNRIKKFKDGEVRRKKLMQEYAYLRQPGVFKKFWLYLVIMFSMWFKSATKWFRNSPETSSEQTKSIDDEILTLSNHIMLLRLSYPYDENIKRIDEQMQTLSKKLLDQSFKEEEFKLDPGYNLKKLRNATKEVTDETRLEDYYLEEAYIYGKKKPNVVQTKPETKNPKTKKPETKKSQPTEDQNVETTLEDYYSDEANNFRQERKIK